VGLVSCHGINNANQFNNLILPLPLFHFLRDPVDSQIVEHRPVGSRTHLIRPRRSELSGVFSVIVDTARINQDRVSVEQTFAGVDLILQSDEK